MRSSFESSCTLRRAMKGDEGRWNGTLYSMDQGPDGIPISSLTLQDSTLKFSVDAVHGAYKGKVAADGNTIAGTWTQGKSLPLEFRRTTNPDFSYKSSKKPLNLA